VNERRDDAHDSNGPDPQEWYTGGASSGQAVIDPRERPDARLASMFDSARAHGAMDGTAEDLNPNDHRGARVGSSGAFRGRGRTLNSNAEDEAEDASAPAATEDDGIISRVVTFWQNGFTVDDGPLRTFDDPANVAFMESIGRGEAPAELAPRSRTERVNINLVQRHEPYVPPKEPKYKAFAGSGRTLASEGEPAPASTAPASTVEWTVDESQPTTSIQIRLRDGSRLVAKFNTAHTVAHIRSFIARSRPNESFAYTLQLSGFPPKTLSDDDAVIADAGLAGAVVIQR
jgi:UBX domain-containing protein 1